MNPSGKLARLERLVKLREPDPSASGPSRTMMLVFLLVLLPMAVLWAHGAFTSESGGIALNGPGMSSLALTFSAQISGDLLYPETTGRLLRVLARLVLLPVTLMLFLATLYQDFGVHGFLTGLLFLLCLAVLVGIVARFSGPVRERRR